MNRTDDPFLPLLEAAQLEGARADDFAALQQRPALAQADRAPGAAALSGLVPAVGRLLGFDLLDRPRVGGLLVCPGEILNARSTVPLRQACIGRDVLLVFENGDPQLPIILGVINPAPLQAEPQSALPTTLASATVQVDGERQLIEAEREIVLRCGEASITLTRAGKVLIQGHYIVSRSSGYNKIKGAAIDIN